MVPIGQLYSSEHIALERGLAAHCINGKLDIGQPSVESNRPSENMSLGKRISGKLIIVYVSCGGTVV